MTEIGHILDQLVHGDTLGERCNLCDAGTFERGTFEHYNSFLLAIFQRYMVQNVPDLGHIPIVHTDQKHCNVFLDRIMPAYFQMCKEFILAVRQKYDQFHVPNIYSPMDQLVQNVPDLGHIPILHTDQKHCNVFLDRIMPDIGHISKYVRSLF